MNKGTKYIIGGLASIAIGVFVYSRAEGLTIIKDGKEYPNEVGYIRSKILGTLLIGGGLTVLSYGAYSKLK